MPSAVIATAKTFASSSEDEATIWGRVPLTWAEGCIAPVKGAVVEVSNCWEDREGWDSRTCVPRSVALIIEYKRTHIDIIEKEH